MQPIPPEILTITSVLVSSIVGPFVVEYFKKKWEKKIDPIHEDIQTNILVEEKVNEIKDNYKADRVYILQFHNGGQFYPSGKSMKKFSMSYESVSENGHSVQTQFQNIPISLFTRSMSHLYLNDFIAIPDFSNDNYESFGLKYMSEENTNTHKSSYLFAIKAIDGKFIGVLGINYLKHPITLTQQKMNQLANEATLIGGVLLSKEKK
jgi:hypothetical protein